MTPVQRGSGMMWAGTSRDWKSGCPATVVEEPQEVEVPRLAHTSAISGKGCLSISHRPAMGREHPQGTGLGPVPWGLLQGGRVAAALWKELQQTPRKRGASPKVRGEKGPVGTIILREPTLLSHYT